MIDGREIFRLMDTKGLPLDIICEQLRRRRMAFNVCQFVEESLASGNFTYSRIKKRLVEAILPDKRGDFEEELDLWYERRTNSLRR